MNSSPEVKGLISKAKMINLDRKGVMDRRREDYFDKFH